jgi:hypothetical protein
VCSQDEGLILPHDGYSTLQLNGTILLYGGASITITQLRDKNSVFSRPVDDAVLVVDAARPVAGKTVLEGLA